MTPSLEYTPELAKEMTPLYERLQAVIPSVEWPFHAPLIHAINVLKRERGAVILAHNYQTPEIFHGVADITGDSLKLAREAQNADADVIVQCGVHFMAETSKLLNPDKTILLPDARAGCSLAASVTGEDVRMLRQAYPGVPVVTYVNTSAEVKAESDICCTSSNVLAVVESLNAPRVLCIPDEYLARNVARQTDVEVIAWKGRCEVHERFSAQDLRTYRESDPGIAIIAHPECPPDVIHEADFSGSTSGMAKWIDAHRPGRVIMVTECSMSDNLAVEYPQVEFVRPCNLCPHMKRITLRNILDSLIEMREEIKIPADIAARARKPIERMLRLNS
ncbi:MAG: quinolinate synthase NadA [Hyphomicrobiales bacterium]|nr:quinolinate synthase NadA [Hyphomicrobiales bacterium]MCY4048594.1 quinolinate synthase NadA [Hyphomicrobiales bacterium]MCY4053164.1 quinolinate synthase NadA [Hyphomicrobiales bacterium]